MKQRLLPIATITLFVSGCAHLRQQLNTYINPFYMAPDLSDSAREDFEPFQHPERFDIVAEDIIREGAGCLRRKLLRHKTTGRRALVYQGTECSGTAHF